VLLEQVDQREVEGARARLRLLQPAEQPRRLLLQVRVQLAHHHSAFQAAATFGRALALATAAGVGGRPPRVREDSQAEVLVRDAWLPD